MYRITLFILIILFFNSCGSSGSSSSKKIGYLIDSAVSGVEYTCNDISGITGSNGEFNYDNSCKVTFKIGGIIIGQINTQDINEDNNVLPADLFGLNRENTEDEKIVKLIQFLQTIDRDNNPDNNIEVTEESRKKFKDCFLDFTTTEYEEHEIKDVVNLINKDLISKEEALTHYKKTLQSKFNINIEENVFIEELLVKNNSDSGHTITHDEKKEEVIIDKTEIIILEEEIEKSITKIEEKIVIEETKDKNIDETENVIIEEKIEKPISEIEENIIIEEKIKFQINEVNVNLETIEIKEESIDKGFSYENQRDVTINISTKEILHNKQILIYEKMSILKTPVGDFEKLENIIISTIFDENGELNLTYTLGNHITSIWLVVPYYGLTTEVPINNNNIYLKLNK